MIRNTARVVQNKFWAISLAVVLPLGLAACGSTSGETSLADSVSLTSPSVATVPATTSAVPQKNAQTLPKADIATVAEAKKTTTTTTAKPAETAGVAAAKENRPPTPRQKPYRKQRARLASTGTVPKGKDAAKPVTKQMARMPAKPVAQKPQMKKSVATVKPTVKNLEKLAVKPVAATKQQVSMVPMQVMPVQIMPQEAPQDIMDAFSETPREQEPEPEKMAKAETPVARGGFGQADHRFSGQ